MTADIPDLGYHALACRCGRSPVLQSGRCWSCEPRPVCQAPPDPPAAEAQRAGRALTARIRAHLAVRPGATTGEIAAAIGHPAALVTVRLGRLRGEGRVTSSGSPLRWRLA